MSAADKNATNSEQTQPAALIGSSDLFAIPSSQVGMFPFIITLPCNLEYVPPLGCRSNQTHRKLGSDLAGIKCGLRSVEKLHADHASPRQQLQMKTPIKDDAHETSPRVKPMESCERCVKRCLNRCLAGNVGSAF